MSEVMPTIDVMPMTTPSTVSAERILLRAQRVERHRRRFRESRPAAECLPCYSRLQRFDRIELRGAHRRIQPEEQPDDRGDADAERPPTRAATAAGSGDSLLMIMRERRSRSSVPTTPPNVDSVTDSVRICQTMSRRRAPSALRRPISRVRSLTTISMMFMITMPPTTSDSATTPMSTAKMPLVAVW